LTPTSLSASSTAAVSAPAKLHLHNMTGLGSEWHTGMVVEPRERVLRLAAVHGRLVHLLDLLLTLYNTHCSVSLKAALNTSPPRRALLKLRPICKLRACGT